jgi:NAD(P)-dependent dehydrogenase (short-subunit alcohol dehydrogenase family)
MSMNNNGWTSEQIPDQAGRVAIVTGANSGLGYETARALARKGAKVIMACRNLEKGHAAAGRLQGQELQGSVEVMQLDLADLASVQRFAELFRAGHDRLDLLINNAGVMMLPQRQETADGFEMQFGTNHLGHFALTGRLLDLLLRTPGSRVVAVSSMAHNFGSMDFEDLQAEASYSSTGAYGQSKLANLLFAYELQRRLDAAPVDGANSAGTLVAASHPGWTATNLQQHSRLARWLNPLLAQGPEMGALPTLYAATAPDVVKGGFYGPGGFMEMRGMPKRVSSNGRSHDQAAAARLWAVSEELTGVRYPVAED